MICGITWLQRSRRPCGSLRSALTGPARLAVGSDKGQGCFPFSINRTFHLFRKPDIFIC